MSTLPDYTVVIATYQRPEPLRRALNGLERQTHRPCAVVEAFAGILGATYESARQPGAATQRNQGIDGVTTPLVGFLDDDAVPDPETFAVLAGCFARDSAQRLGGAAGRMAPGGSSRPPRGLLWWYYRIQAGYPHPHYGGRLFGPGLNTHPCWSREPGNEVECQWLAAGCVLFRTPLAQGLGFPEFPGYSALEDVYFSSLVARTHRLVARRDAPFKHEDASSSFKRDRAGIVRAHFANQYRVATEVQGLKSGQVVVRQLLHRFFLTMVFLRSRGPGWLDALRGVWT